MFMPIGTQLRKARPVAMKTLIVCQRAKLRCKLRARPYLDPSGMHPIEPTQNNQSLEQRLRHCTNIEFKLFHTL